MRGARVVAILAGLLIVAAVLTVVLRGASAWTMLDRWIQLTKPPNHLQTAQDRFKARLFSSVLLVMGLLTLIGTAVLLLIDSGHWKSGRSISWTARERLPAGRCWSCIR